VSSLVDASPLGLLVAMTGMAAISGGVFIRCIYEEDVGSSWMWAALFGASSLVAAWTFGRLT
jgi:hypothetical protein